MQGIKITANKCPEPHAGASKKQVRRTMLIGLTRTAKGRNV